jgi:CelD/BcsL family acetyltransferase involved in cellulose biosynthesis
MQTPAVEVRSLGDLDRAATSWRDLARRSSNVFASWEWAKTWWDHFGDRREPNVLECRREGGDAVAVLPLVRQKVGPLRAYRFIGHGPADQLTPVCADEDRELALAGLDETLSSSGGWDVFLGERVPADWRAGERLGARTLGGEANPALLIGGRSWDDILAQSSSNFRGQVRRRERKVDRELGLRFRITTSPGRLSEDLDVLFALHRARWGPKATQFSAQEPFHRDFAAAALERGWLRLWIAEVGGRPAAAWYGLRYGNVESFYQSGRDPELDRWSVGFVLLAHTIREAAGDGMEQYSFLRGGEGYKSRFADVDRTLQTVARGRTPLGKLAVNSVASLAGRRRGRATVRRLIG